MWWEDGLFGGGAHVGWSNFGVATAPPSPLFLHPWYTIIMRDYIMRDVKDARLYDVKDNQMFDLS